MILQSSKGTYYDTRVHTAAHHHHGGHPYLLRHRKVRIQEVIMGLKLTATFKDVETGAISKVYRDAEWNEYRVRFYDKNGIHMDASDYHTNDKEDALLTAGKNKEGIERIT